MNEVWYVQGADPDMSIPMLFATKECAERYARSVFPDEDPDTRYARVFYRQVFDLVEEHS